MTSRTRSATVGTVVPRAEELYRQGLAENSSGRPLRGLRALTQAARLLSDPILIADQAAVRLAHRVTLARSTAESELNGLDRGLAVLDSVRDHVVATGDRETEVLLELHLGYMRARGGELHDGLAHLDAAVELLDHADPRSACNILLNRGMVRVFLGDLTRARPDYEHALAIAVEHELLIEHAKARHNLGELEGFAGNLARALRLMDEAAGLAAELSPAVAFVDRAKVLMEAGLHREADQTLLEAERLFRADRLWKDVGEVELARAQCALWSGEAAAARRLAGRARDRFRRRANHRWRREAELVLLQADLAGGRPGSRLAPPALRLASEFESEGLTSRGRTAKLLAAEAMLRAGDVHSAVLTAGQAGPVRPADALSARIQTRLVRAQLRMAGEDRSGARREIQTGFAELGRHQARFGSIDLQTAAAVHGRGLADLDLALALSSGSPAELFGCVERGRSVSSRLNALNAPDDPEVATLLAQLRSVTAELAGVESDPGAAAQLEDLRQRSIELQQQLRSRSWQSEGSGHAHRPASLSETTAELSRRGSNLVCYVQSRGLLHALVVSGTSSRTVALGPADIVHEHLRRVRADLDALARDRFPNLVRESVLRSVRNSLTALDDQLVRALGLGEQRLVIVPTGMLSGATWGLFPSLRQRPVVVAPSATAWVMASSSADGSSFDGVACFAGPALARAEDEAVAVGRLWADATVYSAAAAGQQELRTAMTKSSLVHIAAHAQHQTENPLFSYIELADGPVWAYELDRSLRTAGHVILSACEAGQATVRPGDEGLGLTSVLLRLGTHCVVSGVAKLHDDAAHDVMVDYHRRLSGGQDSAAALAEAIGAADSLMPLVCFGASWSAGIGATDLAPRPPSP